MANYPYYGYYPTQFNAFQGVGSVGANQPTQNPAITWVQGEAGAKSYLVGAGQTVLLMDSENQCFYIKSTDASGMPMPLRIFEYQEKTAPGTVQKDPGIDMSAYITREEFQTWADEFRESMKGAKNGTKSTV